MRSELQVTVQQKGGLYELQLLNTGNLAAPLPTQISATAHGCEAGDGAQGYRLQRPLDTLTFTRQQTGQLPAGHSRTLGWVRCGQLAQGEFRVTP